jgi:hypothetical protein
MIDKMRLFEACEVVQYLPPASRNANTYTGSTPIDTADCDAIGVVIHVGDIASTATFNAKLTHSDVSGSGYADITGMAITQLGDTGDNKDVTLDLQVGGDNTKKRYIHVSCTNANAAVIFGVTVIKYRKRQAPVVHSPVTVVG